MSNPFEVVEKSMDSIHDGGLKLDKPTHLSASTISSFIERQGQWFIQKVVGESDFKTSHFFQRGKAVETGIEALLKGASPTTALRLAEKELWDGTSDLDEEQIEKIKEHEVDLRGYIECGANKIDLYGDDVESQKKINLEINECSIPIIGYLDFDFPKVVVDTKVLARKPSGLSQSYSIQGVIYYLATGKPVNFEVLVKTKPKSVPTFNCYTESLTKQKVSHHFWREYMTLACIAIEGVYDSVISGDVEKCITMMSFPNLDSFFSNDDALKALESWKRVALT